MASRRPTSLPITSQHSNVGINLNTAYLDLESSELFTPDLDSPLPISPECGANTTAASGTQTSLQNVSSSVHDDDDESMSSTVRQPYEPRTLGTYNAARQSILPIFPPVLASPTAMMATTPHLLLSNVPLDWLSEEQFARVHKGVFPQLFKLEMDVGTTINPEQLEMNSCESYMLSSYQNLYVKMKKRLKVDISIIDYNLSRVCNCIGKVAAQRGRQQTMLNIDELAVALEFYLQIDVDMFFLKTCSFNGVQPRFIDNRYREGLFCIDPPEPRFAITPCDRQQCLCCHSPCARRNSTDPQQTSMVIPFSIPHSHRFINRYEAILNCPATCESNNCIYVLTCPCRHYDFVGESKLSFADTLARHREEGNRIVREFLIGKLNIQQITHGLKSDEKKVNDKLWLDRHSPRCSVALQLFLDYNPDYWCFVPMKRSELIMIHDTTRVSSSHRADEPSPMSSSMIMTLATRTDQQVRSLMEKIPKPPPGFDFSNYQRQEQAQFFKLAKDRIVPKDNVDLYNADIMAILPDNSSDLLRQLIESLFITHADCKLNQIGHIAYQDFERDHSLRGIWCTNLTRPV